MESSQAQVRLVFAGELLEGHTLADVKKLFGEMFKLEGDRLAAVFSGQRTVLKRTIGRDDGERYVARLRKLGMRVLIEPLDGLPELKPLPAATGATPADALKPVAPPPALKPVLPAEPTLVPLEEEVAEVTCPNCGERQPKKFILCRKCTTDIPRALANKQEEADRARAERLAARQGARQGGRFAPPEAEVEGEYTGESAEPPPFISLSFEGRYGRTTYVNSWGVGMLGVMGIGVIAAVLTPMLGKVMFVPLGLAGLAFVIWSIRINALRLHDLNRSGWWQLVGLVPYLGFFFNVAVALWPGTAEENDFGPKPRRGNLVFAIVITLFSVVGVGVLAAVALPAYQGYVKRAQEREHRQSERQGEEAQEQSAPRMKAGPAMQAFRDEYTPASNEKAFAVSSAGAYGWSSGKGSTREAISAALSDCESRREAYTSQCRVVNINGMSPKEQ